MLDAAGRRCSADRLGVRAGTSAGREGAGGRLLRRAVRWIFEWAAGVRGGAGCSSSPAVESERWAGFELVFGIGLTGRPVEVGGGRSV